MRGYVAGGMLVVVIGCGGNVASEPLSTKDDAVDDSTPDGSAPAPALAAEDAGAAADAASDPDACWVDSIFFDAGAPVGSVFINALYGDPKACGLPSICSMAPAPHAVCARLCGPDVVDCYYTSDPQQVSCATSTHRLVSEWDAGFPCIE